MVEISYLNFFSCFIKILTRKVLKDFVYSIFENPRTTDSCVLEWTFRACPASCWERF